MKLDKNSCLKPLPLRITALPLRLNYQMQKIGCPKGIPLEKFKN